MEVILGALFLDDSAVLGTTTPAAATNFFKLIRNGN
jgi:hypothetical protein